MFGIITGFFSRYAIYMWLGGIIIAIATSGIMMWEHTIKQEAQLEFNNLQLQQVLDQQQKFISDMQKINDNQKNVLQDLNTQNNELQAHISNIESYLASTQAKKDSRPSSTVIKNTIKKLSDGQ